MTYIHFELLAGGSSERITSDDIEPVDVGSVYERTIQPLAAGQEATIRGGTGYTARGSVSGKQLRLTVFDEGVPVAVLAVCLHSRNGPGLWQQVHEVAEWSVDGEPPAAPWAVLAELVSPAVLPPWLRYWAKCVAYSLWVHSQ